MVTCTLDARKLPRLYVGERCKRFQAKTWGRGGTGGGTNVSRRKLGVVGGGGGHGIFAPTTPSISYAVRV